MPVAVIFPACDAADCARAEARLLDLVTAGCTEICCLGPESERLHDRLDFQLESTGRIHVVTTWFIDPQDLGAYLLSLDVERGPCLAFLADHPEWEADLRAALGRCF